MFRSLKTIALLAVMGLAACTSLPADPAKMSAEQLTAYAKDRNATVSCGVVNSPYGRGVMTYVVLDKAVVINGTVGVDSECKVTISNTATPPAAVVPAVIGPPAMAPTK